MMMTIIVRNELNLALQTTQLSTQIGRYYEPSKKETISIEWVINHLKTSS